MAVTKHIAIINRFSDKNAKIHIRPLAEHEVADFEIWSEKKHSSMRVPADEMVICEPSYDDVFEKLDTIVSNVASELRKIHSLEDDATVHIYVTHRQRDFITSHGDQYIGVFAVVGFERDVLLPPSAIRQPRARDVSFVEAYNAIRRGGQARRKIWLGDAYVIFIKDWKEILNPAVTRNVEFKPCFVYEGKLGWTPTVEDMLANDWVIA